MQLREETWIRIRGGGGGGGLTRTGALGATQCLQATKGASESSFWGEQNVGSVLRDMTNARLVATSSLCTFRAAKAPDPQNNIMSNESRDESEEAEQCIVDIAQEEETCANTQHQHPRNCIHPWNSRGRFLPRLKFFCCFPSCCRPKIKDLKGCLCANTWRSILWLLPVVTYAAVRYADFDSRLQFAYRFSYLRQSESLVAFFAPMQRD